MPGSSRSASHPPRLGSPGACVFPGNAVAIKFHLSGAIKALVGFLIMPPPWWDPRDRYPAQVSQRVPKGHDPEKPQAHPRSLKSGSFGSLSRPPGGMEIPGQCLPASPREAAASPSGSPAPSRVKYRNICGASSEKQFSHPAGLQWGGHSVHPKFELRKAGRRSPRRPRLAVHRRAKPPGRVGLCRAAPALYGVYVSQWDHEAMEPVTPRQL